MKRISWVLFIIFFIQTIQLSVTKGQTIDKNIVITWKNNLTEVFSEDISYEILHFEDATFLSEKPTLPCYLERIPIASAYSRYDVSISDARYEPMTPHDQSLIPSDFTQSELSVRVESRTERGRHFAVISMYPFIKSPTGQFSRLTSVTVSITGRDPFTATPSKYVAHSVLANGQWFSFALTQTGVYKITFNDLVKMGMPQPIQSANLAIFGNGGAMLPEDNSAPRADDLEEIPIYIQDGHDGILGENDYLLFYGRSPHPWHYDTLAGHFRHVTNIYSDSTHYFITCTPGVGEKKRIQTVNNNTLTENRTTSTYLHYDFYEEDSHNLGESNKEWLGDLFDATTTRNYGFSVPGYRNESANLTVCSAHASTSPAHFSVNLNGQNIGNANLATTSGSQMACFSRSTLTFTPPASSISVQLNYSKPTASSSAYLDWLEIEVPCNLSMHSPQVQFRDLSTLGSGNITKFIISNATSQTVVWDVTVPSQVTRLGLTAEANGQSFKVETETLREFIAFDGSLFLSVVPGQRIGNQDLHATQQVDMIIVTHPKFLSQANRLAEYRNAHGVSTKVVTTQQVYNEFSSGSQDPIAIRDYVRMIYNKTAYQYPKYLLLFGRPSYDYRGHINGTEIYVPNYQYAANNGVISEIGFYANDDTFGLLDHNEGTNAFGFYDIAVGRFPCSTTAQANTAVEKSINYTEKTNLASGSTQISNFGDWRNIMAFVADDEEYNDFITNADNFTQIVANANRNINFDKIYLDAYQQVSNAGGQRYPDVTTAINNRMNRGALCFTYIGHSGKDGWANERILENSDINKWSNRLNMPVMLTLSCTFGYYDRPAISPAELSIFNNKGGVSAIITATREAWSSPNNAFGRNIFSNMFNKTIVNGRYPTVGELSIYAKNKYGQGYSTSLAMFVLMGDPSMPFAIPYYNIVTDSINHVAIGAQADTARALSKVTISGHIENELGQMLDDFNGTLYPSVYDKKVTATSLANDPASLPFNFDVQKNILFKGNSSIRNGRFTFSFYVPKDIDYSFGEGKISYYGCSDNNDAAGEFSHFIIGGTSVNGIDDKEGPVIDLFLNDENFVNGGVTNSNPTLLAKIKDQYGINTTGNGIGHDIVAILDNATEDQIVLNDYYQTDKDSFNSGTVRYNLSNLVPGEHTLTLRAWDINNNHSESELRFEVTSDEKLTLRHVLNYPNPFTTHTDFFFEQNQNGGIFDIQIQIYTISGKLVRTITSTQHIEGNRSQGIGWDGLDDFGDKIGKGVYMYKLRVRNQNNETAEVIEKLVIL